MDIRTFIIKSCSILGIDSKIKRRFSIQQHKELLQQKAQWGNDHKTHIANTDLKLLKSKSFSKLKSLSRKGNFAIMNDGTRHEIKSKKDSVLSSLNLAFIEYDSFLNLEELKRMSIEFRKEFRKSVKKERINSFFRKGKHYEYITTYKFRGLSYTFSSSDILY